MLLATVLLLAATCPIAPPESLSIYSPAGCGVYAACPNGPVEWQIGPAPIGPNPTFGGYRIEPCDTVDWSFGDGTTATVVGADRVTHDYPLAGNYPVQVTVTNSLGSTTAKLDAVIATAPSKLAFVPPAEPVGEDKGPVTVDVVRSGDLSRTVSADAVVVPYGGHTAILRAPLQFAPGETEKTIVIPIANDQIFSGTRLLELTLENPRGGVLTTPFVPVDFMVVDDDPPPVLTIDPAVTVAEGDAGLTPVLIPIHLSAPMGVGLFVFGSITPVAIGPGDVGSTDAAVTIPAGETSGVVKLFVRANTFPEPDKSFLFTLNLAHTNADPILGDPKTSFVTVLNDDAAIYPAQIITPAGFAQPLTLNIGSPFREATTVTFTSSAPDVVPVPDPVMIPAGETKVWVTIAPRTAGVAEIGAVVPGRTTQPSTVMVTGERRHAAGR